MTNVSRVPRPGEPGSVEWLHACIDLARGSKFSEFGILTPAIAAELLCNNAENRSISKARLAQYITDVREGRWQENGQSIIVSDVGTLNDGQHRCLAVVETNIEIPVQFTFGLPRDSRFTLDQGKSRTGSDILAMEGAKHAAMQASVSKMLIGYERSNGTSFSLVAYVSNIESVSRAHADEKVLLACEFAARFSRSAKAYVAPSTIAFCYYVLAKINQETAELYLTQVCRGEGLIAKNPAYAVRDRLLSLAKGRGHKVHTIIRGWNAVRTGRNLGHIKIMGKENLPRPI